MSATNTITMQNIEKNDTIRPIQNEYCKNGRSVKRVNSLILDFQTKKDDQWFYCSPEEVTKDQGKVHQTGVSHDGQTASSVKKTLQLPVFKPFDKVENFFETTIGDHDETHCNSEDSYSFLRASPFPSKRQHFSYPSNAPFQNIEV